ncbi:hypothetical protein Ahy_A01g004769 [Arachis hypogaea]|uniref:Squalene cyclase C-terminal domain-containing protein n=1 Tax=Arachis hypogaea TaxID=3818 RepID=A0A445EX27_ARAHY|nr:hypothetical protein Ahy_A01g004769 [Arachis hypogaea]
MYIGSEFWPYLIRSDLRSPLSYGCWGICYTYGTWFAVDEGLKALGRNYHNSPSLRKACEFLLSKLLPSGSWGESYLSSQNKMLDFLHSDFRVR